MNETASASKLLELPACVANSTNFFTIDLRKGFILRSFASLPRSATDISLNSDTFASSPDSTTVDGFNADGSMNWDEVWQLFPQVSALSLTRVGLYGPLPDRIPTLMTKFVVSFNALSGSISSNLFSNLNTLPSMFQFSADNNKISGTLPDTLFVPLRGKSSTTAFSIDFSFNSLTGSLPSTLISPLYALKTSNFLLNLGYNSLQGSLPSNFLTESVIRTSS